LKNDQTAQCRHGNDQRYGDWNSVAAVKRPEHAQNFCIDEHQEQVLQLNPPLS